MVEKNKLLSDLLDDRCDQADLDDLLGEQGVSETLYRYNTVSAILKDEHSANASFDFCSEVSAKIAEEPAIIAAPRAKKTQLPSGQVAEIKRLSGGFAIAASVAVATFFSFQTIQVADTGASSSIQTAETQSNIDDNEQVFTYNEREQTELALFNSAFLNDFRRSEKGKFAPVSGELVRTVRLSAEEWQAVLAKSFIKQQALEEARKKKLEESEQR